MSLERRIRALRAKAASTAFPEEADTARQLADKLEAKLKTEQPKPEPQKHGGFAGPQDVPPPFRNPFEYTWAKPEPKPERKPRRPWQGSMGDHDALYREALERIQKELERDRPGLSHRVRDILARRMANSEMIDRFGVD